MEIKWFVIAIAVISIAAAAGQIVDKLIAAGVFSK